jgi:hypothetical protein
VTILRAKVNFFKILFHMTPGRWERSGDAMHEFWFSWLFCQPVVSFLKLLSNQFLSVIPRVTRKDARREEVDFPKVWPGSEEGGLHHCCSQCSDK